MDVHHFYIYLCIIPYYCQVMNFCLLLQVDYKNNSFLADIKMQAIYYVMH